MDNQTADICIKFLQRITLAPGEINAFMQVKTALEDIARWQPPEPQLEVVEPTDDLQSK